MATYAVGDIQGCFAELEGLLRRIAFDPTADRLWLVGDLVNRGPASLQVLRWAKALGDRVTMVLGNHDLHLLCCRYGLRRPRPGDTFEDVLTAPDGDELMDWLASRPFVHREGKRLLVHAGLSPSWDAGDAVSLGEELAAALRQDVVATLAAITRKDPGPRRWADGLDGVDRLRALTAVFTRLRTCTDDGSWCASFNGPPAEAPFGCRPWFEIPGRRSVGATIVFGHWSALGLHVAPGLLGLDTGCVWGRSLTAVRLEDGTIFQEPAGGAA